MRNNCREGRGGCKEAWACARVPERAVRACVCMCELARVVRRCLRVCGRAGACVCVCVCVCATRRFQ